MKKKRLSQNGVYFTVGVCMLLLATVNVSQIKKSTKTTLRNPHQRMRVCHIDFMSNTNEMFFFAKTPNVNRIDHYRSYISHYQEISLARQSNQFRNKWQIIKTRWIEQGKPTIHQQFRSMCKSACARVGVCVCVCCRTKHTQKTDDFWPKRVNEKFQAKRAQVISIRQSL